MAYKCLHCSRTFATSYALKRHISDKYRYITEDDGGEEFQTNIPVEESDLWDEDKGEEFQTNISVDEPSNLWDDDFVMDYEAAESTLEQDRESQKSSENLEEKIDVDHETGDVDLIYPLSINLEDFCETTLNDAINDKMHPPNTEWPNKIYKEFIEIIIKYRLSNSCGDRIIKLINKSK